jgi:type II secretory pathway pseudopilin PulG
MTGSPEGAEWMSRGHSGFTLLYVVISMTILAFLGLVMISLFASSATSSAQSNISQRALYLAESGIRYTRSEFRQAPAEEKSSRLHAVHQSTYRMEDGGRFRVEVRPSWLYFAAPAAKDETLLSLSIPGSHPEYLDGMSGSGTLEIAGTVYPYTQGAFMADAQGRESFTLRLTSGLAEAVGNGTLAFPSGTVHSISGGTVVVLTNGYGFHQREGHVSILGERYRYDTASFDGLSSRVTLEGVRTEAGEPVPASGSGAAVTLLGHAELRSTGSLEGGFEVSRVVHDTFLVQDFGAAGPGTGSEEIIDFDGMKQKDLEDVFTEAHASELNVKRKDGDDALNIKSGAFTTGLKWWGGHPLFAGLDLGSIRALDDGLLSYRVQVKMAQGKQQENDVLYVQGVNFRLDDSDDTVWTDDRGNTYAVSLAMHRPANIKKRTDLPSWYSGFSSLPGNTWHVVLWKQTAGTPVLVVVRELPASLITSGTFKDWTTIHVEVEERFGAAVGRSNRIVVSLADPDTYPRTQIGWNKELFIPVEWEEGSGAEFEHGNRTVLLDSSLTTEFFDEKIAAGLHPREIGLHALHVGTGVDAAEVKFYDDLAVLVGAAGGGSGDGFLAN